MLKQREFQPCAVAVMLMLWGGIPYLHLRNLCWRDVCGHAQSGKPLLEPLPLGWLMRRVYVGVASAPVLPRGWSRRWYRFKRESGINQLDAQMLKATYEKGIRDGSLTALARDASFWEEKE